MSASRVCSTSAVINGRIYVIGGKHGTSSLNTVQVYDPATDTWTTLRSMSSARRGHTSAVVNGKIYVIGGDRAGVVHDNEQFTPEE